MNSEAQPADTEVNHAFHVSKQTWTHIALHCKNIDEMIAWYEQHTHFSLLFKEEDPFGAGAWMGDKSQVEQPFVLVCFNNLQRVTTLFHPRSIIHSVLLLTLESRSPQKRR